MTDIMSEIPSASGEQTAGIEQINEAINQMDQVTQQNAALVEEAAAAASLQDQAIQLASVVSVFKVDGVQQRAAAPARKAPPSAAPRAAPARPAPARQREAVAAGAGDWEEF